MCGTDGGGDPARCSRSPPSMLIASTSITHAAVGALGIGDVLVAQDVRAAVLVDHRRFHTGRDSIGGRARRPVSIAANYPRAGGGRREPDHSGPADHPHPRGGRAAGDVLRAVLRPRLRLRGHPAVAPSAGDLTWSGAAETAFMLVALYWAWNYTTWMTNWFDPDTVPVRLVLVFVMLASLLMAVAIPEGFGEYALLFACAYSGLQIGRNAFVVAVTPRGAFNQNFRQILAWSLLSAPLWVAGGIVDADAWRWVLWLGALGLDLAGPLATYWLPGAGTTPMSQWQIEGAHFGERFQLFVIIALGESVVLAGATASDTGLSVDVVAALLLAFLSSTALWWLYFGQVAGTVLERIRAATADERGQIGRDIYTYLHLPIIAGIVLVAVGDELVIAHPTTTCTARARSSRSPAPRSSSAA